MNTLRWKSNYEDYTYEPLYLANNTFGGLLNLSGTDLNLWSANIVGSPDEPEGHHGVQFPVTALRTQVYYQSPYYRQHKFLVSNAAILCDEPIYTSNPSMPHKASIYQNAQSLDLTRGVAETSGTLYLGSLSSLEAEPASERAIQFKSEVVFLKESATLSMKITANPVGTEIILDPVLVLEDAFSIRNSGNSIYSMGNEMQANIVVQQSVLHSQTSDREIIHILRPNGGEVYSIRIRTRTGEVGQLNDKAVIKAMDLLEATIEIFPNCDLRQSAREAPASSHAAILAEQSKRWAQFWQTSRVTLPPSEALWQERYQTSLFYVAQSVSDGPTHPVGLSQPMLPYWYGSFHDTDTYFCRPLLEAGHFKLASLNLDYRHRTLARAREIAAENKQAGALYPWEADPHGNGEAHLVPLNQAIIAAEAWHQFCHRGDARAAEQAMAICEAIFENLIQVLDHQKGRLVLSDTTRSTFSETVDAPHAGEVYLALRATAEAYLALSQHCPATARLTEIAEKILVELLLPIHSEDDSYAIIRDKDPEYMRCPSLTLGAYPLRHLPTDARMSRTFDKELSKIVSVFAWMPHQLSCVASRIGRREGSSSAYQLLKEADRFYKTWHAYDEWENRRTVRAKIFVTAAGGFCTALHHMLLAQTDAHTLSLFHGIPPHWSDGSFENLTSALGWTVSATLKGGAVTRLRARPSYPDAPAIQLRASRVAPDCEIELSPQATFLQS